MAIFTTKLGGDPLKGYEGVMNRQVWEAREVTNPYVDPMGIPPQFCQNLSLLRWGLNVYSLDLPLHPRIPVANEG